jgi:hypothetical protein
VRDGGPRAPLDLDAVEARALAAWLDADAGLELEDDGTALPGGVLPGFAERVMEAESSVVQIPALVAIDVDPTPEASPVAPRGNRRWGLGVAAAFVAGLSSLWVASQPGPATSTTEIVATPAADATSDAARPAGLPIPDDLDARIADYIADYGRHFGPTFEFHGTILVARDGKIHYQHGFGVADPRRGVENAPATRMRIGMLTEQFTATAILQLRDAGMLQLSDPIEEHLPGFPNGRRITIENLLDHTSGIPNYTDVPTFHRWKALPHRTEEMIGRFSSCRWSSSPAATSTPPTPATTCSARSSSGAAACRTASTCSATCSSPPE